MYIAVSAASLPIKKIRLLSGLTLGLGALHHFSILYHYKNKDSTDKPLPFYILFTRFKM